MTQGLGDLRTAVHGVVVTALDGLLPADSVHPFAPMEVALPMVFLGSPIELRPSDPATVIADVDVIIAVDGADESQRVQLDALEGAVWLALDTFGTATVADGIGLGVGGPTVHAVRITVEVDVAVHTLCPPLFSFAT